MKLIMFPLIMLLGIAMLCQFGLMDDALNFGHGLIGGGFGSEGWYDYNGHLVQYANGTNAGENGRIFSGGWGSGGEKITYWSNNSAWWGDTTYKAYDNPNHLDFSQYEVGFNLTATLGFVALVVGTIAVAVIAGVRLFGGGESEFSVSAIVKGGFYVAIWGVLSGLAYAAIIGIPLLGVAFFFFLTAMYCIGVVNSFGGGDGL